MKTTSHLAAVKAAAFAICVLAVTSHVADAKKKKKDKYDEKDQDATNSEADLSDNHKIPSDPVRSRRLADGLSGHCSTGSKTNDLLVDHLSLGGDRLRRNRYTCYGRT